MADQRGETPNEERSEPQLVVIGASAGGLDALSGLLEALPEDFQAPIVVAQHLDPNRVSRLPEILARRSTLPVRAVEQDGALEAGVVYIVPPNRHAELSDGHVHLFGMLTGDELDERAGQETTARLSVAPAVPSRQPVPSIDHLLASAAEGYGDRLIAVILSGSGSDGAAGAREVKQAGGTVVVQDPRTATHPSMPQSLAPGIVDIVAEVSAMGHLLQELLGTPRVAERSEEDRSLRALLSQLRERSGVDFSHYKTPTIMRRLKRRLVATGSPKITDYLRYIHRHPEEYPRLVSSFLIKVTGFFRDPELFAHLREQLLPELIAAARERGNELRLWSAGCATGEEAYSLAILVADALGDELEKFSIRIFATDLDPDAVAFARRGIYPVTALQNVPGDLIERFFIQIQGEYEVRKHVRTLVVFGQHDLGQRAPFPRIDLALCRNVLIYFTSELQRRALQLFAFALREGGYLALGKAETTSPLAEYFTLSNSQLKIYRRHATSAVALPAARIKDVAPRPLPRPPLPPRPQPVSPDSAGTRVTRVTTRARTPAEQSENILLWLPIGVVVIDRRYDIQSINGEARRLLGIHSTAIGEDFIHLIRGLDANEVRSAIDETLSTEKPTQRTLVSSTPLGDVEHVQLSCSVYRASPEREPMVIAIVTDSTAQMAEVGRLRQAASQAQAALDAERRDHEQELARLRDQLSRLVESNRQLLAANQELASANAELYSANEELLVGHEEAEAAMEEVETLNEELQATNEEQETLNEELQATVEELNTTNDDLQARSSELQELAGSLEEERSQLRAVLAVMREALLVLNENGNVVLTNPAYDSLFGPGGLSSKALTDEQGTAIPPDGTPLARAERGEQFTMRFTLADGENGAHRDRFFEATARRFRDETVKQGTLVTIKPVPGGRTREADAT
jgi:two-component system, chemotaxis family, CheB/CheR fusion protein